MSWLATMPFWAAMAGAPAPVLVSLDFDLADTDGGDTIVITGTDLDSASSVTVGGTSATITGNTSTTVAFTMPAKSSGSHNVQVTTPGGVSNTLAIEAWSPLTETSCTFLCERPDYSSGTGTWSTRLGTALNDAGTPPSASGGAPIFAGADNSYLDGDVHADMVPTTGGSMAVVSDSTNTNTLTPSTPYLNPTLLVNETNGTLGLAYGDVSGTRGWMGHVYDGTAYRTLHVAATISQYNTAILRFDNTSLDVRVNGGAFSTTATTGLWGFSGGNLRVGGGYNGLEDFRGTPRAIALFDVKISDAVATKLWKWGKCRHGSA
jgi:hypothetical protein